MELRPELCPPVVPPQRIAELCTAVETIEGLLERGESADAAIAAFNADTDHAYTAYDFLTYWKSRDVEDFALEAARPVWPKVENVTREELIEIVRRIQAADDDTDYYVLLLHTNVLHPRVTSLIFYPPPELANATPEDIVDAALSYRPIAL
ncbi:bacteriocin immunity protein [Dactylosporangium sp. NPDC005572]|uniref:bacteriocin immunity protein n=1 Tax=Dactylosporangium sp. NPDC005572 TaxID=3156889 RepID=UPI00339E3E4C